jgi:hypothetical protein
MGPQPCAIVVSGSSATISSLNYTPQQTTYYTGNNTTFEALATDENNNSLNVPFTWKAAILLSQVSIVPQVFQLLLRKVSPT